MQQKTCFKCDVKQPITEFYVHPQMGDGRLNKCKTCTRRDVRENYEANIDRYRAYDKRRGFRPSSPIKRAARYAVKQAIISGRLIRGECEMPGSHHGRIEAHHDDYSKPLQIRWLCKKHHGEIHTEMEIA